METQIGWNLKSLKFYKYCVSNYEKFDNFFYKFWQIFKVLGKKEEDMDPDPW